MSFSKKLPRLISSEQHLMSYCYQLPNQWIGPACQLKSRPSSTRGCYSRPHRTDSWKELGFFDSNFSGICSPRSAKSQEEWISEVAFCLGSKFSLFFS